MNLNRVLETIEQIIGHELNPIQKFVLFHSWQGKSYMEMAQQSNYDQRYLRDVGSSLWKMLSEAMGEKVTKKNLSLLLNETQLIALRKTLSSAKKYSQTQTKIDLPGSALPVNSPIYIHRPPNEELVFNEISQPGCLIRIKAPWKMGKSSLLQQLLDHTQKLDYQSVCLDFQEADKTTFASTNKFLRWFCLNVTMQLNFEQHLDEYWDEEIGSIVSCRLYFEAYLLSQINTPIVIALNEVNRVFEYPDIAQDFLSMLRYWHELGKKEEIWHKLRLVVVHSTEVYTSLKLTQSPFNVGLSIRLPLFNWQQVQELAQRYGFDWNHTNNSQKLTEMTGGHPYLVNLALYHLIFGKMQWEEFLETAPTQAGIYSNHLRRQLVILQQDSQLVSALKTVIMSQGEVELDAIAAYKLESMGLVKLYGNQVKPACELYRIYFQSQLR
ncbi:MAG: AAA-like domain-containing protein [Microcoleaceae cyanobacterium MO_207.B10]|nr:AAA-like domain-containing protein [Microcoleaceae cyanobacterium MO_207.B10]